MVQFMNNGNTILNWGLLLAVLLLGACGAKQAPLLPPDADVAWDFAPNGIVVQLVADTQLNWQGQAPSSLSLCLLQLSAKTPAMNLVASPEGLEQLLSCELVNPTVLHSRRIFITPGESAEVFVDREAGVKMVLLVAGYHEGVPAGMALMQDIPVPPLKKNNWMMRLFGTVETVRIPEQCTLAVYLAPTRMLARPFSRISTETRP